MGLVAVAVLYLIGHLILVLGLDWIIGKGL